MPVSDSSELAVFCGGTRDREQDASCDLSGFMSSSSLLLLTISASLTVLFSYLALLDYLRAQEQIQGEWQL